MTGFYKLYGQEKFRCLEVILQFLCTTKLLSEELIVYMRAALRPAHDRRITKKKVMQKNRVTCLYSLQSGALLSSGERSVLQSLLSAVVALSFLCRKLIDVCFILHHGYYVTQ